MECGIFWPVLGPCLDQNGTLFCLGYFQAIQCSVSVKTGSIWSRGCFDGKYILFDHAGPIFGPFWAIFEVTFLTCFVLI